MNLEQEATQGSFWISDFFSIDHANDWIRRIVMIRTLLMVQLITQAVVELSLTTLPIEKMDAESSLLLIAMCNLQID